MQNIRARIERSFEVFARFVFHHKWSVLLLSLVCIGLLLSQIRKLTVDTSTDVFFFKDDPEMVTYDHFREQFGRGEYVVVAIRTPDVFSAPFLEKLKVLHSELEKNVPYLHDITSLVNVTAVRGEADELIIEELMENWPADPDKVPDFIEFIRAYAQPHALYRNYLLSEDGRFTAILLESEAFSTGSPGSGLGDVGDDFGEEAEPAAAKGKRVLEKLSDKENAAFVKSIFAITDKHKSSDFPIFVAGPPVLHYSVQQRMQKDVPRFTALAVLTIFLLLFVLFRRFSGVLIPLFVVVLSMLSTLSLLAVFGKPFTVITQILPSFLLSVGVCNAVHLLAVFYRRFQVKGDKEEAMVYAMGHSGLAILMTSLTTAGGLLSFSGAKIAPISDLGIFAAAGVMLAFLLTLVLLPALLAIFPVRSRNKKEDRMAKFFDRVLVGTGNFATDRPWIVIAGTLIVIAAAIVGISRLHFSHNPIAWFPSDDPFPVATGVIDKGMKGSMTMEAVVDTGKPNMLYQPEVMNKFEAFNRYAESITMKDLYVGKSISVVDTLKQINKSLNENRDDHYRVPQDRKLIAQEFILFENGGTDDLENLIDTQYSKARVTIKLPWKDANTYAGIQNKLIAGLKKTFGDVASVTITGMISLLTRTVYNVILTMISSYAIAGVVITLMMILLIGNLKYGLISMVPNLLPIVVALGLMGFAGMNLDLSNVLIGSVIIGLAVDDTVHFFHNFRRYFQNTGNVKISVQETLLTTGRAMLFTSLVLTCGFFLFVASDMLNLVNFGFISGLAIITALLADIILAPALMVIFSPEKKG